MRANRLIMSGLAFASPDMIATCLGTSVKMTVYGRDKLDYRPSNITK